MSNKPKNTTSLVLGVDLGLKHYAVVSVWIKIKIWRLPDTFWECGKYSIKSFSMEKLSTKRK